MSYERTIKAHPYWLSTIQEFLLPDISLENVPNVARIPLAAAIEAIRQGDVASASVHMEAAMPLMPPASSANAFAHAARGLCQSRAGLRSESVASLRKALEYLPDDPRLLYSLGFVLLQQRDISEAVACFQQAVAIAPDLGLAWAALALISCLEQDHAETEKAARQALRLGCPLPGGLVELALMQATRLQGKAVEGAFDFSTLSLADNETEPLLSRLLATMPPVDPVSLVHPAHGRPIYFVYADHLYVVEHVVPLILSIAETGARCAIHLHVANPGRGLAGIISRLRTQLNEMPLIVSTESVFVEQFAAPAIYHSCMRFVRFWQVFMANTSPMAMLDADVLARRDPAVLEQAIDPAADVVLALSDVDPYWSRFYGGYVSLRPKPGAASYISRVAAFILDNFSRRTARWFLDQTALAACHDLLKSRVSFEYLPWMPLFGGLAFTDEQVFWTAHNEDKYGDNPHTRLKEDLRKRHGFKRSVNDEPYRPELVDVGGMKLMVNAPGQPVSADAASTISWRKPEIDLLAGLVRPGHTVVDAGAGFGAATIAFARAAGTHGRVHAFEPDRLEFQNLAANLALTGATNVFPLSSTPDVDDLELDACHLIRIGGEIDKVAALAGAARTLARHHPFVYVADAGSVARAGLEPMRQAGYTLYLHVVDESCVGVLGLPRDSRVNVNGMQRLDT